jgi:hypothetical protein
MTSVSAPPQIHNLAQQPVACLMSTSVNNLELVESSVQTT